MRTLPLKQLKELNPCYEGFKWYSQNIKTENVEEILTILSNHRWDWCRWLFVRLLDIKSNRILAIYCAELVLPIFEGKHPSDKRPREAIEAARLYLKGEITLEDLRTKRQAAATYVDAYAYAYADAYVDAYAYSDADAVAAAAYAAAYAAAAYAASDAAAAYAYADAAYASASAHAVSAASRNTTIKKIIKKAVELLNEVEK